MRTVAVVLTVAALAAGALLVRGQPDRPADPPKAGRTITVAGTGTATGTPDTARVSLGVSATAKDVLTARQAATRAVQQVRAAVAGLRLPDLVTRTTASSVGPQTAKDDPAQVVGYTVQQAITVRLSDPDPEKLAVLAERVLDAGLANGANFQGGVEFFRADDTALRRQAQQKAVEDALQSAQAFAAGAKLTVAEVLSIDGSPTPAVDYGAAGNSPVPRELNAVGQAAPPGGTLATGAWEVTSTVRVVCRY